MSQEIARLTVAVEGTENAEKKLTTLDKKIDKINKTPVHITVDSGEVEGAIKNLSSLEEK